MSRTDKDSQQFPCKISMGIFAFHLAFPWTKDSTFQTLEISAVIGAAVGYTSTPI